MREVLGYGLVWLATYAGVGLFRRWSTRKKMFDVPNERSSHSVPTPRGGGLIMVVVCLAAYVISAFSLNADLQWGYLLGALAVALISWIDDLYTISSVWRFAVHAAGALLAIFTLDFSGDINIPLFGSHDFGFFNHVLVFFWIVWLTNAYNFMDGIDGIAGLQALTAGIGWYFVGNLTGAPNTGFYGGILAASAAGFLLLNWQPAKIFMGDVGSAFLGYSFAVLPLMAKNEIGVKSENEKFLLPAAVALVWLFVFDTLWTFGRRVLNGEKVWEAHRRHLYQRLIIEGFSHRLVSGLYGMISGLNVFFVLLFLESRTWETALPIFLFVQAGGLLFGVYYLGMKNRNERVG